ncbi:MAG: Stf0 family sulfotransferase, partial [Verrucomicrobiota bacterium]
GWTPSLDRFHRLGQKGFLEWLNARGGIKLFRESLTVSLRNDLQKDWPTWMERNVSHCIYLEREDTTAQAVSMHLARSSQIYQPVTPEQSQRQEERHQEAEFDFDSIRREKIRIEGENYFWQKTLGEINKPTLHVRYENMMADKDATIREIARFLGKPIKGEVRQPNTRPSSRSVGPEFRERFLEMEKPQPPKNYLLHQG